MKTYAPYGVKSGGELYLPLSMGKRFVDAYSLFKVAIISLEFFRIPPGKVIPVSPLTGIDGSSKLNKYEEWDDIIKIGNEEVLKVLLQEEKRIILNITIQRYLTKVNGDDAVCSIVSKYNGLKNRSYDAWGNVTSLNSQGTPRHALLQQTGPPR